MPTFLISSCIFAYIASLFLSESPVISIYIPKIYLLARVAYVASDYDGKEDTVMDWHIIKSYVADVNEWLGLAVALWIKRIKHTARPASSRLLLLLRSQIDSPPDWSPHDDIFVVDVFDLAWPLIAWVCFQIDSLKRFIKYSVNKGHISHTVMLEVGWNTANR